jgi:hypothetical protein
MRRILVIASLATLLSIATTATMAAAQPVTERVTIADVGIHDDGLTALCGFDVWFDGSGHITFRTLIDADGNPVRDINNFAIRVRYYSEFASVSTGDVGPDRVTYEADGSLTVFVTGNLQSLTSPGEGRVYSANGWIQLHVTFDAEGNATQEMISEAGQHTDADQGSILCELLGPA